MGYVAPAPINASSVCGAGDTAGSWRVELETRVAVATAAVGPSGGRAVVGIEAIPARHTVDTVVMAHVCRWPDGAAAAAELAARALQRASMHPWHRPLP
jgi:hypothetical protein